MAGRLLKRSLNHIIHRRMPWKAASTVSAGQTMQTPTVHPAATARMRNTNISAHSKGNGNPKTVGVQKCPKRRNRQSIEPRPALSLCAVASYLALHTWSASRNMFSQFLSTIGWSQAF